MIAMNQNPRGQCDDATLLVSIASGDLDALGELFDRQGPALHRYIMRLGLCRADADDVLQTVFLEVHRAAKRYEPSASARSWLFGVTTMIVRRERRSLKRRFERAIQLLHTNPPSSISSHEAIEAGEEIRRFADALGKLEPKKREIFTLIVLEELSGQEVADALGIPLNTVWSRLHHARRDLTTRMERRVK